MSLIVPADSRSIMSRMPMPTGLMRALGAMGLAELSNRFTRILTAVVLARMLTPLEFGSVAIALTASEIIRILTSTGLGARIIQCRDVDLAAVCGACYRLNWRMHLGVAALQVALAFPIAQAYGTAAIGWMVVLLALPYLVYPFAAVQVYRVQREGRMAATAAMLTTQTSLDNLLTAGLALAGFGIYSVVAPKLIVCLIWVIGYRWLSPWRPDRTAAAIADARTAQAQTMRFGAAVLGAELFNALRLNADKLIIGHFAGLPVLGVYYFACNAGLGITTGIVGAFGTALLPHFARLSGSHRERGFWQATAVVSGISIGLIALQVGLAPLYVPLVFGARWTDAVPLLMLLCASGITLALWRSTTQFIRATGQPKLELLLAGVYAAVALLAVLVTASFGLMAVAIGQIIVNLVVVPLLALWAVRRSQAPVALIGEAT